jgi:hypothetical protein
VSEEWRENLLEHPLSNYTLSFELTMIIAKSHKQHWAWTKDLRFPTLNLVDRRIFIPKPALVRRPRAQIPRLHQEAPCRIDIALSLELLDSHLHASSCEDHVLGLHFVARSYRDLAEGEVALVANKSEE